MKSKSLVPTFQLALRTQRYFAGALRNAGGRGRTRLQYLLRCRSAVPGGCGIGDGGDDAVVVGSREQHGAAAGTSGQVDDGRYDYGVVRVRVYTPPCARAT